MKEKSLFLALMGLCCLCSLYGQDSNSNMNPNAAQSRTQNFNKAPNNAYSNQPNGNTSSSCHCTDCKCSTQDCSKCKCDKPCPCVSPEHNNQNAQPPLGVRCPCKPKQPPHNPQPMPPRYAPFEADEPGELFPLYELTFAHFSVADTNFRTEEIENQELGYSETTAQFIYINSLNSSDGYSISLAYIHNKLDWNENPFFDEKNFGYVDVRLGGFTTRLCDWNWRGDIGASFDTHQFSANYILYHATLWGRYNYCDFIGINVGFLAEVGLNKEKVWPILGVDFSPAPKWNVSLVFPLDMDIEYELFPQLSLDLALRFFRSRHRVAEDEPLPEAIYEYHTEGLEFGINYHPVAFLSGEVFTGLSFPGDLKITNRSNHDAIHNKFDSSIYFGFEISANF